jgi:hypothetical protein
MPKGRLLIESRDVVMEILAPIDTSGYTRKTKEDLMEKVRSSIYDAFEEISKE